MFGCNTDETDTNVLSALVKTKHTLQKGIVTITDHLLLLIQMSKQKSSRVEESAYLHASSI